MTEKAFYDSILKYITILIAYFGGDKTLYDDIKAYEPIFGSYTVARKLGDGRYGKVYEIERKERKTVFKAALKHITIPLDQNDINGLMIAEGLDRDGVKEYLEDLVNKVYDEVVLMSSLKGHSNIVGYEDYQLIEHDDRIQWDILVRMELLTNLIDYIGKTEIKEKDVINLGIDICKALEVCGKKRIIHRDVSPDNIYVSETGEFKLGDFGVSRMIESAIDQNSSAKGNPVYMAPELYSGNNFDAKVDIYSLGIVMYQLLNKNRVPFMPDYDAQKRLTHEDKESAVKRRMNGEKISPPKDVDSRLAKIILKSIEFKPKDRYESPAEMRAELEAYKNDIADKNLIFPADKKDDDLKSEQESVIWRFEDVTETESVQPENNSNYSNNNANANRELSQNELADAERKKALAKKTAKKVKEVKEVKKEKKPKEPKGSSDKKLIAFFISAALITVIVSVILLIPHGKNYGFSVDDAVSLDLGDTYQLVPVALDNDADGEFEFVSHNADIASVSEEGLITAKSAGNTTISVIFGENEKEISVTVLEQSVEKPVLEKANLGDEFYAHITDNSGSYWLTGYDGKVYFQKYEDDVYQIFRFTRNGDGTYRIQLAVNDMTVTAGDPDSSDAYSVLLENPANSGLQSWLIEKTPENGYIISSKAFSDLAIAPEADNLMHLQEKSGSMQVFAIAGCSEPTLEWRIEGYESYEPYEEFELLWFNGIKTGMKRYTGNVKPAAAPEKKTEKSGTGGGKKGSGGKSSGGNSGGGGSNPSGDWTAQGDW